MDLEKVTEILEAGTFDSLIGLAETHDLEFKGEPYLLDTDFQKRELVKDVTGFANAGGGILVLGIRHEKNPTHQRDEAVAVRAFLQSLVNPNAYHDVLRSWTYPSLTNVHIKWYPSSHDCNNGLIGITVPPQDESQKPFLIKKTIEEKRTREVLFGHVERHRDNVKPSRIEEIHSSVRIGTLISGFNQRLDRLEALLRDKFEEPASATPSELSRREILINERITRSLEEAGLKDRPAYVLLSYLANSPDIQGLFSTGTHKAVELLHHPPHIRNMGFALSTGDTPQIVRGELWRAGTYGSRQVLELWRDGTIIFLAKGDEEFLCWGPQRRHGDNPINPYVLVETAYLFCQLASEIYKDLVPPESRARIGIGLANYLSGDFKGNMLPFRPGIQGYEFGDSLKIAPAESILRYIDTTIDIDLGRISFLLVSQLYEWFGHTHDVIPFTTRRGENIVLDIEALVKG